MRAFKAFTKFTKYLQTKLTMKRTAPSTSAAGKEVAHTTTNAETQRKEKGPEMKGAENSEVLEEGSITPSGGDEYTLEAFGDISLSNIDFVPPPPSTLSPRKLSLKNKKFKGPVDGKASISGTNKRRSHKIRAPSLSKARIDATQMNFETLVEDYRQSVAAKHVKASLGRTGASRRAAVSEATLQGPQPEHALADLKNLGGEAVISGGGSHDIVENSGNTKGSVGSAVKCAARGAENGAFGGSGVEEPRPKQHRPWRGNAQLPKRPPIPRWDDDNSWQSATGLEIASRYKLT